MRKLTKYLTAKTKKYSVFSNVVDEFQGRFMKIQPRIHFGNRYVYYFSQLRPDKVIQFYRLTSKYISELEADYMAMKFAEIKLHQYLRYFDIQSESFQKALDFAEQHQLPVIIHLYGKKDVKFNQDCSESLNS